MDTPPRFERGFGWPDAVLAVSGVIGLLLVILLAPREHPHSTASEYISYDRAVDSARVFAQHSTGLQLTDATAEAFIRYDGRLLNELQRQRGRGAAITMLRDEDVPAYSWHVEWSRKTDGESESLGWTRVTLDGRLLGVHVDSDAIPRQAYHGEALARIFDRPVLTHSLPPNRLAYRLDAPERGSRLRAEDVEADRVFLDRADAEALALYHLGLSRFTGVPVRVDSVFASGSDGLVTATVKVSAEDDAPGRFYRADVEVMPNGTLVELEPKFVAEKESGESAIAADDVRGIVTMAGYVMLAIILVVVFFRRLNARVVDTKTAIRDGLACALAASIVMSTQLMGEIDATSPMEVVGFVLGMFLAGLTGGILMFFISGAALSMAREHWDAKLQTLALVRSLFVRNVPVGTSTLRGIFAGLALAGIGAVVLLVADGVWLHFEDSGDAFFGKHSPGIAVLRDVGGLFYWALFLTLGGIVGIGALFRGKKGSFVWSFIAIVVTLTLLQAATWDVRPLPVVYAVGAVYGLLLAGVFWRFDGLTAFIALFVFALTVSYVPNWSVPTAPEFVDGLIAIGVVGLLAAVGVAGVLSGKGRSEIPAIVPDYIRELAQRERLNRELELAREVQLSFLPARTPDVRGLDLASVCLPAYEVGGDYFDFFRMNDGRLGVVVGDVSGKGMQAAFYMTLMKGILQSLNTSLSRPSDILAAANTLFRMNAPRGIFMSIVLGVIDLETRTWTCARAGHNPMLIHRAGAARPEEIKPRGAAIGLASDPIFSENIEEASISLTTGDLLLIYTDGITEAMNHDRELFDETRLDDSVARASGQSASAVLASIIDDIELFTRNAPRHDDMTMVAIRILTNGEG